MGLFRFDCLQPLTAMYERLVLAVLAPPHSDVPANIYYHSSQGRTSESSWVAGYKQRMQQQATHLLLRRTKREINNMLLPYSQ